MCLLWLLLLLFCSCSEAEVGPSHLDRFLNHGYRATKVEGTFLFHQND